MRFIAKQKGENPGHFAGVLQTRMGLEGVRYTNAETGLTVVTIVDTYVAHFTIRRPVFVELIGQLHVVLLGVRLVVVAVYSLGAAGINIVQLGTPVAHHKTGPRIATVHFIVFFAGARRVAGIVVAIAGGHVETIIEAVLHAQVWFIDRTAVVTFNIEARRDRDVLIRLPLPANALFMTITDEI